ncbi:MAG: cytochrome b/b6 domain-containing protein, partial [Pseudomonadota bacterium]
LQIFNAHPALYVGEQSGFEFDNAILKFGAPPIPGWATIPSGQDLATGRVIHFFFAWIFLGTVMIWAIGAILSGHFFRDLLPRLKDFRSLTKDIVDHLGFRFSHGRSYGPLQKLSYAVVLFGLFPLMIFTGLAMSPGANAALPWLTDAFGGRQTARTLHFVGMALLFAFFIVHMAMIVLAGPLNELRAIITGYYRANEGDPQ